MSAPLSAPTDTSGPLFGAELISPAVLKALPEGYSCRPLEKTDYANGFLDVLRVLTTVGDITEEVRDMAIPLIVLYRGRIAWDTTHVDAMGTHPHPHTR